MKVATAIRYQLDKQVSCRGQDDDHKEKRLPFVLKTKIGNPFQVGRENAAKDHQKHQPKNKAIVQGILIEEHKEHAHQKHHFESLPLLDDDLVLLIQDQMLPYHGGRNQKDGRQPEVHMVEEVQEQRISGKTAVI